MAFDYKNLNNIASSLGSSNLWIYESSVDTLATIIAAGYFNGAVDYGMRNKDFILIWGGSTAAIKGVLVAAATKIVTLTPLTYV